MRSTPGALAILLVLARCSAPTDSSVALSRSQAAVQTAVPKLAPERQLRRITLALEGVEPTLAEYRAVQALTSDDARDAYFSKAIDDGLASPRFYEEMLAFGHEWLRTSAYTNGSVNPAWWHGDLGVALEQCPAGTLHAGAWTMKTDYGTNRCDDGTIRVDQVQDPWWAAGTTVTTLGNVGSGVRTFNGVDCGLADTQSQTRTMFWQDGIPGCSCGPHLIYCSPKSYTSSPEDGRDLDGYSSKVSARRDLWDEPGRLFAHLAVNDRPFTDLILGDYTVATLPLQRLYMRVSRQAGFATLDDSTFFMGVTDPRQWREVKVEAMSPLFLADRSYHFDARVDSGDPKGIPSAGVLTMLGSFSAFPRERVRAARWLEILACQQFNAPDPSAVFTPFQNDPSTQGSCQHCHGAGGIDATAIHFKRVMIRDSGDVVFGGLGPWQWAKLAKNGLNQRDPEPRDRWNTAFIPNTGLTPITDAELAANPEARFIDFLPPDKSLFGQKSDGTIGPLGFAKLIVASGAFDRCVARRVYAHLYGRELNPAKEGPYIEALATEFVDGGRKLRPFIRALIAKDEFRRGF